MLLLENSVLITETTRWFWRVQVCKGRAMHLQVDERSSVRSLTHRSISHEAFYYIIYCNSLSTLHRKELRRTLPIEPQQSVKVYINIRH